MNPQTIVSKLLEADDPDSPEFNLERLSKLASQDMAEFNIQCWRGPHLIHNESLPLRKAVEFFDRNRR